MDDVHFHDRQPYRPEDTTRSDGVPRILLTATLRWPIAARLAGALGKLGCHVEAACPREHPAIKTRAVCRVHPWSTSRPLATLRAAIEASAPDLIIPCDDDAALQLNQLHVQAAVADRSADAVRALIERSLGSPAACELATARSQMLALADRLGVRTPDVDVVATSSDLEAWLRHHGFPVVMKIDGSWGGQGVAIVHTEAEAKVSLRRMRSRPSLAHGLERLLLDRDASVVRSSFARAAPTVSVQEYIAGTPANRAVACWQGRVLAGTSVEAIRTLHPTGPATVVRVIDQAEMSEAVARIVRGLGVSGLWGFDFVLDASTGAPYLIEVNPRATPISHLGFRASSNLPAALYGQLTGNRPTAVCAEIDEDVIAMFPGEWRRNPASTLLRLHYHDVPWDEPELVRDCIDRPWSERGFVARLWAQVRPRPPGLPTALTERQGPAGAHSSAGPGAFPLSADISD